MRATIFCAFVCALTAVAGSRGLAAEPPPGATDTVVFLCEHGAVKSVMAAAYFNRAAQERGIAVRAVARGVTPDEGVPDRIATALAHEGFDVGSFKPQGMAVDESEQAMRVVAIGVEPSPPLRGAADIEQWNDVPASSDYDATRAALMRHIAALLQELQGATDSR
jgi:arsenate reductase (thioredoxin)